MSTKRSNSDSLYGRPNKLFKNRLYDAEHPVYRWVSYNHLSDDQKARLPDHIQKQVADLQKILSERVRTTSEGYHTSILVVGQNLTDPSDMLCALHQNHGSRSQYTGFSAPRELIIEQFYYDDPY